MTKRIPVTLLLLLLAMSLGMASCAKKEGLDTPFTRLIGKWKKVKFATDDNNNGTIDSWEIYPVQPNVVSTLEFNKDSTGVDKSTFSPDLKFHWQIVGDVSVRLSYEANDTVTYRIVNVSSANLDLTTRTTISLAGYYYDRD